MDIPVRAETTSVALPPYRAVLAVDAEKFSRNPARYQQVIGEAIPDVLERAFQRSGLGRLWADRRFPRHSGDGYVIGLEPEHLPFLIHPFLDRLQDVLFDRRSELSAQHPDLRLRLRASIDVGPLPDSGTGSPIDAMGEAMIHTHRLLDAEPVKRALADSHPDATLLAAIVSRRVYEDAVLSGFGGVHQSRFRPVHVSIAEKEFAAEGYLYVPVPSSRPPGAGEANGDGAAERAASADPTGAAPAAARVDDRPDPNQTTATPTPTGPAGPRTHNSVGTNNGQVIQADTITGDLSFHGKSTGGSEGR